MTEKEVLVEEWNSYIYKEFVDWMVVVIQMPNGKKELVINHKDNIEEKVKYYLSAYDDDLCLKSNKEIQIINYMFA